MPVEDSKTRFAGRDVVIDTATLNNMHSKHKGKFVPGLKYQPVRRFGESK
jgi:hypothetical protein